MATILAFKTSQRLAAVPLIAVRGPGAPAEIVFFPGVRYERWADAPHDAKAGKRARRRDKLELKD